MTATDPQHGRRVFDIHTAHFAGVIVSESHASRLDVTYSTVGGSSLFSITDRELEVPAGSPVLDELVSAAANGAFICLTRNGHRVAAVVPAEIAESLLRDPFDEDDEHPEPPIDHGRRTLGDLWLEQGVPVVTDPAELRGEGFPDFDQFLSTLTSERPQ
jgi:hypothetical protein